MTPQQRIRRILGFRDEVAALVAEGAVGADDPVLAAIGRHHDAVLRELGRDEALDLNREEARLSAGMRLATLLGAAALSIAWAMFVASVWDHLGAGAKLALVWVPPLLLVPAIAVAARRDRSGYIANIVAVVASIALAVASPATLELYQLPDARWPFFLVGWFAMLIAMRWRLLLPQIIGIVALGLGFWSLDGLRRGVDLGHSLQYGEPVLLGGLLAFVFARSPLVGPPLFRLSWRIAGTFAVVMALLVMGINGAFSWLGQGAATEGIYQVVGFGAFVAMTWLGLRRDDLVLARGGGIALIVYLLFRMFDWFWDTIPDWLFFLVMGGFAFGVLLVLRRVRLRGRQGGIRPA
ncbi:MAG TPA: DUF2157 domain-containing protein [Gemmatimonadales bacterium]|nr:DUF2157 domain-containing protein [Gemmatimonadales bacterium]